MPAPKAKQFGVPKDGAHKSMDGVVDDAQGGGSSSNAPSVSVGGATSNSFATANSRLGYSAGTTGTAGYNTAAESLAGDGVDIGGDRSVNDQELDAALARAVSAGAAANMDANVE